MYKDTLSRADSQAGMLCWFGDLTQGNFSFTGNQIDTFSCVLVVMITSDSSFFAFNQVDLSPFPLIDNTRESSPFIGEVQAMRYSFYVHDNIGYTLNDE